MTRNYLQYGFYPPHVCRKKPLGDYLYLCYSCTFYVKYYVLVKEYTDNINKYIYFYIGVHAKKHDKGT